MWARPIIAFALLSAAIVGGSLLMAHWWNHFRKPAEPANPAPAGDDDPFAEPRRLMVERQLAARDITDRRVLDAMADVPRHRFVPSDSRRQAYEDHPLPIGLDQTISQPYIVALMTQLARPTPDCKALEVGVGSGYQSAVLAALCKHVYGIEILPPLAEKAAGLLRELGYDNVTVRCGDGYRGWPEHAPFDVILVTAAPERVPQPLLDQLAPGGRLVIPVGDWFQELLLIERRADGSLHRVSVAPVQFVPMTGEAARPEQ